MTIFAPSESDKYNKHLKGMDSDYELPDVCEKVDYTDGDVMIIDNVRHLEEQYKRLPSQNLIILCCKGRMQLDVNGRTLRFGENEVLFSSPGAMLSGFMFSADFDCKILCLSNRIIQELLRLNIETWNRAVYVHRLNIVRLPDEEVTQFNLYYALIRHKMMQKEQRQYSRETMQAIIRALLFDLCTVLESYSDVGSPDVRPTSGRVLFDRFLSLLAAQAIKRRPVGFYADKLSVTPKYLTMVCQQYSDKAASEWINQYVVEDVRHALKSTTLTIKEISDSLGFVNISHFGSYVRRHFGMSPSKVREEAS